MEKETPDAELWKVCAGLAKTIREIDKDFGLTTPYLWSFLRYLGVTADKANEANFAACCEWDL